MSQGLVLPLPGCNFTVELRQTAAGQPLCAARFSEVSGLEVGMEPKSIREGGRTWGQVQRVGYTSFATVILRRGITASADLFRWLAVTTGECRHGLRLNATIRLLDYAHTPRVTWILANALPVKFKAGEWRATASEVAIEEVQFVHEGLSLQEGP